MPSWRLARTLAPTFHVSVPSILPIGRFFRRSPASTTPRISLPLATTVAGLPQGMMLSAGHGRKSMLLSVAYELEDARPWRRIQD